jgi:hypothetical protein
VPPHGATAPRRDPGHRAEPAPLPRLLKDGAGHASMRATPRLPGLLAFAIILTATVGTARSQVSPGPLAKAHSELEGTLHCVKCHGAAHDAMEGKCLECHVEIAWLRDAHRGLHGQPGLRACATCHPDHAGVDFELIAWEGGKPEKFDHARAGWPLEGKHASLLCKDCHQPKLLVSRSASLGPHGTKSGSSWIGLERECRACHEDIHRGALGADCARCHDTGRWKTARNFDHAMTAYPLTGKHAKLACAACHEAARLNLPLDPSGKPIPLFKPLPHQECGDCHTDPHQGRLGAACSRCHGTDDFHKPAPGGFDHERTRYPLQGAHRTVACARCHDPKSAGGTRPAFARCADCHRDPHAGQASIDGKLTDCAACHSVGSFKPSTFTVQQHAATAYPLVGAHLKVPCAACHPANTEGAASGKLGTAGTLLHRAHDRCTDCHADAHGGQLAHREDRGACESCHGIAGWTPAIFTTGDHGKLRFPLEGRHAATACAACHGAMREGLPPPSPAIARGTARVALQLDEIDCAACHRDPHAGRFKPADSASGVSACARCHDTKSFAPSNVGVEAHKRFTFELEGAHRAVPCKDCHKELAAQAARAAPPPLWSLLTSTSPIRVLGFSQRRSDCAECHRNPHGDQFVRRAKSAGCQSCHGLDAFRPAVRFDHQRDTTFPLDGAHAHVACTKCHVARSSAGSDAIIVYHPVPTRCEDCHVGKRPD